MDMTLDRLYETFELIDDWEERYRVIIDLGGKLPPMPEEQKTEETKVRGCLSQVWMVTEVEESSPPRYHFIADSDAAIVKGLIGVLMVIYDQKTADEIADTDINEIFEKLELEQHISPNRRNGFYSMVERIKSLASVRSAT